MRTYTTPTHHLEIEGVDLTDCNVYVTYRQGTSTITKQVEPVIVDGSTTLSVTFTQAETATFGLGLVEVQVNWVYPNGARDATEIEGVEMLRNLLESELSYDE